MDYEKKYKEALTRAESFYRNGKGSTKSLVYTIFPELAESEDKKIRKELTKFINDKVEQGSVNAEQFVKHKSWIAWLEKQGEKKETLCDKCKKEKPSHSCQDITALGWWALEKQGGQKSKKEYLWKHWKDDIARNGEGKPADKVEPKFKDGDWIVYNDNLYHIGNIALQRYYECLRVDGTVHTFSLDIDSKSHLWTIKDAKDGDVLYCKSCFIEYIVMNKGVNEHGNIDYYFRYNSLNGFGIDIPAILNTRQDGITPATKEQRDLLFQKMKEAGYVWDAEKKELKKIEENPAWSEEDERIYQSIMDDTIQENQLDDKQANWLRTLKDRYTWKPSDEQMDALSKILKYFRMMNAFGETIDGLKELEEQLKKLRKGKV